MIPEQQEYRGPLTLRGQNIEEKFRKTQVYDHAGFYCYFNNDPTQKFTEMRTQRGTCLKA